MSKRTSSRGWLRSLTSLTRGRRSQTLPRRRIHLEQLEPRYALNAAPIAQNDSFSIDFANSPVAGQLLVLFNDSDPDVTDVLTVGEINGTTVTAPLGTPVTLTLAHGTLTLSPNHQAFSFLPASGFTGDEQFTYRASDGLVLSNAAAVTINVHGLAFATVPPSIDEGQSLTLDGSLSTGPGLTYFWSINSMPVNPTGSSSPTLTLPWGDLDAFSIVDGSNTATIVLRVEDGNEQEAFDTEVLMILDVLPEATIFTVEQDLSGCGGTTVTMHATIVDPNPNDTITVAIDWNWDVLNGEFPPTADQTLTFTGSGTFMLTATHTYDLPGFKLPTLLINGHNPLSGNDEIGDNAQITNGVDHPDLPGLPLFVEVVEGESGGTDPLVSSSPVSAAEGQSLVLGATLTDVEGGTFDLQWDLDNDGAFAEADEPIVTGVSVAAGVPLSLNFTPVTWAQLQTLQVADSHHVPYAIRVRAVEQNPACGPSSGHAETTLTILNVSPENLTVAALQSVAGGPTVTVSGSFTDPGLNENYTVHVVWESGDEQDYPASGANGSYTFTATNIYASTGAKPILVTVSDDEDGSTGGSASVTVQAALSATGTLAVLGISGSDDVTISSPAAGMIRLESNSLGAPLDFATGDVSLVQLDLGEGDDTLFVGGSVTETVLAFGGAGNDTLIGGGGSNVLVGGSGLDALTGRGARDILIGGDNSDLLAGGAGQDILVDGATTNDANAEALLAILAEWTSGNNSLASFQQRVRRLSGLETGGLNGSYIISALNNTTLDLLLGGAGNDWVISHNGDISFG